MKETPEGAEIPSHVLMLRAGLIHPLMAGAYTYLPLGLRLLRKAETIVREEIERVGAVEVAMPALMPLALWEKSGRAAAFGDELLQLFLRRSDRKAHVVLGPAHEEAASELAARFLSSYRQLPLRLYQVQAKFRNEERPRFGILRTSEFLTLDAYSFDASCEGLGRSYGAMNAACRRVLERCGLGYLAVEAESGPTGGDASHEFMVPAHNGEDVVLHCADCGYAASADRAEIGPRGGIALDVPLEPLAKVPTPGAATIEQVAGFLRCRPEDLIKTLIYVADGRPVVVLVRGDCDANENKIRRMIGAAAITLADPETIRRVTGAPVGFAGPVGLRERVPIYADHDVQFLRNAVTGANEVDAHWTGVNPARDFQPDAYADLRAAVDGDPCPRCSSKLAARRAIEVAHIFKLDTRYSEAFAARFRDAQEQTHALFMGSYQIGLNRLLAALVETSHDDAGILWPVSLAPYEVLLAPLMVADPATMEVTSRLHDELAAAGVDVLVDDRDQRPGFKFKDADLVGFPLRVVLGERGLREGQVEIKWRWNAQREMLPVESAAQTIASWIREERATNARFCSRQGSVR